MIRRYFHDAATHGVTGTYDLQLPSPSRCSEPWGSAEAEGRGMWLAAKVENLASSTCPPRSPAVVSHASITTLTTLCFLTPRHGGSPVSSSSTLSRKEQWRAALT